MKLWINGRCNYIQTLRERISLCRNYVASLTIPPTLFGVIEPSYQEDLPYRRGKNKSKTYSITETIIHNMNTNHISELKYSKKHKYISMFT